MTVGTGDYTAGCVCVSLYLCACVCVWLSSSSYVYRSEKKTCACLSTILCATGCHTHRCTQMAWEHIPLKEHFRRTQTHKEEKENNVWKPAKNLANTFANTHAHAHDNVSHRDDKTFSLSHTHTYACMQYTNSSMRFNHLHHASDVPSYSLS